MKQTNLQLLIIGSLLIISMLSTCKKDTNESNSQGVVKFTFQNEISTQKLKSANTDSLTIPVAIFVSITTSDGEVVYDNKKLELINFDGAYFTNAIGFTPGNYILTEFMVVNKNNTLLYATPKKGSKLESLVHEPLPIKFWVSSSSYNTLSPEVVVAENFSAEELGYKSFNFNIVKTIKFLVTVKLHIVSGYDVSEHPCITVNGNKTELPSSLNQVYTKDDAQKYILKVWRTGFLPWTDTLTAAQLAEYSKTPLIVGLKQYDGPSYSITFKSKFYGGEVITGPRIEVSDEYEHNIPFYVEWGCGITEKFFDGRETYHKTNDCSHDEHTIKIWGPLGYIKSIYFGQCWTYKCAQVITNPTYSGLDIEGAYNLEDLEISLTKLTSFKYGDNIKKIKKLSLFDSELPITLEKFENLEHITFAAWQGGYLDISNNTKLTDIEIYAGDSIIFGDSKVTNITIKGEYSLPNLNTEQYNKILVDLLANVKKYPRAGTIKCRMYPTLEGKEAQTKLINNYGWTISERFYN